MKWNGNMDEIRTDLESKLKELKRDQLLQKTANLISKYKHYHELKQCPKLQLIFNEMYIEKSKKI